MMTRVVQRASLGRDVPSRLRWEAFQVRGTLEGRPETWFVGLGVRCLGREDGEGLVLGQRGPGRGRIFCRRGGGTARGPAGLRSSLPSSRSAEGAAVAGPRHGTR